MNKELIASKFFKHLDDTALIGYSDFYDEIENDIIDIRLNPNIKTLKIYLVEVLDIEWDFKEKESIELKEYLKPLLKDYISRNKELIKQQKQIKEDEKEQL